MAICCWSSACSLPHEHLTMLPLISVPWTPHMARVAESFDVYLELVIEHYCFIIIKPIYITCHHYIFILKYDLIITILDQANYTINTFFKKVKLKKLNLILPTLQKHIPSPWRHEHLWSLQTTGKPPSSWALEE